jgi:hypothetical protein
MLSCLDNIEIKFCYLDSCLGISLGDKVWIDHRSNILEILVHEVLHIIYPDLGEMSVRKKTNWFIQKSTWFQKCRLLYTILLKEVKNG